MEIFEICLRTIAKSNINKKNVMDGYQQIALLVDEMIDEGIVINTDSDDLEAKIYMREFKTSSNESSSSSYFSSVKIYYFNNYI
jgi:hypothetical protein